MKPRPNHRRSIRWMAAVCATPGWRGLEEMEPRLLLAATALPDSYSVLQRQPLIADGADGRPAGVLANDIDAAQALLDSPPVHGSINLLASGAFTYTPDPNFHGDDSFTYRAAGAPTEVQLIAANKVWNWMHPTNGVNPANFDADFNTTWQTAQQPGSIYNGRSFNQSGPAILGYGGIDFGPTVTNIISPSSTHRYTAYFLSTFNIDDASRVTSLTAQILADDGAFIYINGQLVGNRNMGTAADTYTALALNNIDTESVTFEIDLDNALPFLNDGVNYLAVSVHNQAATSSDLGFQMTLDAVVQGASSAPATVMIQVQDGHLPLSPVNDVYTLFEDSIIDTVNDDLPGLTANDEFLPGDSFDSLVLDTTLTRGVVEIDPQTGHFIYSAEPDFYGSTTFAYSIVNENGQSTPARVTLNVRPVADGAIAVDDHYLVDRNGSLSFTGSTTQRIGTGALWRYSDDNTDWRSLFNQHAIPNDWHDAAFNPDNPGSPGGQSPLPAWGVGASPLGYGDAATQATTISFGPDPLNKYPAYYFLREFDLGPEEFDQIALAYIDLRRDDGAAVYINGQFAFSQNMPEVIDHATPATIIINSSSETAYYRDYVNTSLFVPGRNVVAVEVHQQYPDSSDVSFDLRLTTVAKNQGPLANDIDPDHLHYAELLEGPTHGDLTLNADGSFSYTPDHDYYGPDAFTYRAVAEAITIPLLEENSEWNWMNPLDGIDPALADPDFNTTWQLALDPEGDYNGPSFDNTGAAMLGYGVIDYGALTTVLPIPPDGLRFTAYFATTVEIEDPTLLTGLTARVLADDGAFIYINGHLVTTLAMPPEATDTYFELATDFVSPELNLTTLDLSSGIEHLRFGVNYISVSVHSHLATSTDLAFLMMLQGLAYKAHPSQPATVTFDVVYPGDLNENHTLDAGDIDLLFAHIRTLQPYARRYDLNDDGVVDQDDVEDLVTNSNLLDTTFGDANLNGVTTLGDLIILATNFNQPGGWAMGDFSGNGQVSIGDLIILAGNYSDQPLDELTADAGDFASGEIPAGFDALRLDGEDDSDEDEAPDGHVEIADILNELGGEFRN